MTTLYRSTKLSVLFVFLSVMPIAPQALATGWDARMTERFFAHTGSYGMQLALMALTLVFIRLFLRYSKSRRQTVLALNGYVTRYHVPIGWASLVLSCIHSVYYIVKLSPKWMDTVSGLVGTVVLIAITYLGIILQRNLKLPGLRRWHISLSVISVVAIIMHNYYADLHAAQGLYQTVYWGQ